MPKPKSRLRRLLFPIEAGAFRLVVRFARAMSVERASAVFGRLAQAIGPFTKNHARALAHLGLALPETSPAERVAIVRAMWDNLGRTLGEGFHLDALARAPERWNLAATGPVAAAAASGRGSVMVSLHMGNWEIATMAAIHLGHRPAAVYRALSNPAADATLRGLREAFYPGGLLRKDDTANVARRLMYHVRGGGTVAILADVRDPDGLALPFFGRPATATRFPAFLSRSLGVPLIAARVVRRPGLRFSMEAVEIEVPRTTDRDDDVRVATERIHALYETWIREYPDQWMWTQRKWGLRPIDTASAAAPPASFGELRPRDGAG